MNRQKIVEKVLQRWITETKGKVGTAGVAIGIVAESVVNALAEVETLYSEVVSLGEDERKESERHNNAKTQLQIRLEQIQAKCKHPCTTYYPDASGNNDLHVSCDICGKEL